VNGQSFVGAIDRGAEHCQLRVFLGRVLRLLRVREGAGPDNHDRCGDQCSVE
jgi:hypothetical protein